MFITSCNWGPWKKDNEKDEPSVSEQVKTELQDRVNLYCLLSSTKYDENLTTDDSCDAALFTALHGVACDYVEVSQFESKEEAGKLCRRPDCGCYPDKSKSGFSKDMATGMQLFLSRKPDSDLTNRIVNYGKSKSWVVCEAVDTQTEVSRCLMSPKIVGRWFDIQSKAEGIKLQSEQSGDAFGVPLDYQAHLQVVGILTEGELYGAISDSSLKALKSQADREPNNLLYRAADARYLEGDTTAVAQALLKKFPADRLPTSADWCTDYLYQRDETRKGKPNNDWLPCPEEGHTFAGTDFLIAAWTLLHE